MNQYCLNDLGFILCQGEDPDAEDLWDYIPQEGPTGNLAGETIRAVSKIAYRFYNDGDYINEGYGHETCDPAAGFLIDYANDEVAEIVIEMCEGSYCPDYEGRLHDLCWAARNFVTSDDSLWDTWAPDMFGCDIPDELKYWDDDEEEDGGWDDEGYYY